MEESIYSENDIEAVIRYLKVHDPKNADRDYAVQLLEAMQGLAHDISKSEDVNPEIIQQALDNLSKN